MGEERFDCDCEAPTIGWSEEGDEVDPRRPGLKLIDIEVDVLAAAVGRGGNGGNACDRLRKLREPFRWRLEKLREDMLSLDDDFSWD